MRYFSTIRFRLFLLVFVALLPSVGLLLWIIKDERDFVYQQAAQMQNNSASYEEAVREARAVVLEGAAYVSVCVLLSFGMAWFLGTRLILRRINRLMEATGRIRLGNLSARTGMTDANDELSQLGRSFDAMAQSLEQREADLQKAQQQMIQKERLSALGQMASGIAHDFNNALSPVLGFTEILLDDPQSLDDKEKVKQYLELVNTSARDAAKIVKRLREFYRSREEGEIFAPVNIGTLMEEVKILTQPRWQLQAQAGGREIRLEVKAENVPEISGNESELREMFTNLIFNAVDAMPDGGVITLSTREDSGRVLIEVRDTGTGMTEEIKRRCMEPFFTTKGDKGTGLGLAMVFGIVKRHGGTVELESAPGKGTAFLIRFPVPDAEIPETEKDTEQTKISGLRVLVVDDDVLSLQVVEEYLKRDVHTVETARSGREGKEKFQKEKFNLVITAGAMPEINGYEMAKEIKKIRSDIPVVLLSGFSGDFIASARKPEGVDALLRKPVTLTELRGAVAALFQKT